MRLMFARALTVALAVLGGAAAMAFPKLIVAEAVPEAGPPLIAARMPDAMTVIHVAPAPCPGAPGNPSPRLDEAPSRRADSDSELGRLVDAAARAVRSRPTPAPTPTKTVQPGRLLPHSGSAADPHASADAGPLAGTGPHPCSRSADPRPCRGAGRDPGAGEGARRRRRSVPVGGAVEPKKDKPSKPRKHD